MGISRRIFDTSVQKNVAEIDDQLVEFSSATTGTPSGDAGIIVNRGSSDNVFVGWDESEDKVVAATTTATGSSTGNLTLTAADFECKDLTTTADITINGGDLSFGNGQNATTSVAATAHNAAGKNLTITAGTTTAGTTNNIAGGSLTLQGGQGKGSGAGGDIVFQVANAGGSGSSLNAHATAVTISDDKSATFEDNVTVKGDIILDDGGSLKEAGGTAAITFDGSGNVTKIGQDSPSSGQYLKWDGAKWVADAVTGSVAGSVAADDITTGDAAITIATSTGNITIDAQASDSDIILKGTDGGVDTTFLTIDGSEAGAASFNNAVTVGTDLTVTGGDITFGNAQDATASITATGHAVAGRGMTISAGSTTAGTTNNIAGGSLTLQGGQGKGSGAGGDIVFQTANAAGSGSSLNSHATALTISDDKSATFEGNIVQKYDGANSTTISTDSSGDITITPTGGTTKIKGDLLIRDGGEEKTIVQIYDNSDDGVISGYANNSITTTIHANGSSFFNGGSVGIGTDSPGTLLQLEGADAYLTLKNSTAENGDGGAETRIIFEDHGNNALGQIEVSHSETSDDEKGKMIFSTNNDSGLQTAFTINHAQNVIFAGNTALASDGSKISFGGDTEISLTHEHNVGLILESNGTTDSPIFTLKNTNADATGASLKFLKDVGSNQEADDDVLGNILFNGQDEGDAITTFAKIVGTCSDVTNNDEGGQISVYAMGGGTGGTASMIEAFRVGQEDVAAGTDYLGVFINPGKVDNCDFIVHGTDTNNILRVDTSANLVAMGTHTPSVGSTFGLDIENPTTSSASEGAALRLSCNDGAAMASGHRLGVLEFAGAEDSSSNITVGARIEALCDAGWSATENGASLYFYTTDANAVQSQVLQLDSNKNATFAGDVTVSGGDITYGNGQNATASVAATAHDTAGKNLTITAGPTTAGTTNNIAGGTLTLQGGQGKGSGAGGDIVFQVANAAGSGSSLNSHTTALTISDDQTTTFVENMYVYKAINNGSPSISLGSGTNERFIVQAIYDSGAQTLDKVEFSTAAASGTANKGKFVFDVDGTDIFEIHDNGVSLASGKAVGTEEITYTDGDSAISIADGGGLTFAAGDIGFGNGQDSTITIANTAHNTQGKQLTISAGAPTAGTTNNIAGGNFTINGGQGKGSGVGGDIVLQVAPAGGSGSSTNALVDAVRVKGAATPEVVINEGSIDLDFRVETNNATHMLWVDGSNDGVAIGAFDGSSAPAAALEIATANGTDAVALKVTHAEVDSNAVNIDIDALTTANGIDVTADALTTGAVINIDSNSSSTGTRQLVKVHNNHTSAVNAVPLQLTQDAADSNDGHRIITCNVGATGSAFTTCVKEHHLTLSTSSTFTDISNFLPQGCVPIGLGVRVTTDITQTSGANCYITQIGHVTAGSADVKSFAGGLVDSVLREQDATQVFYFSPQQEKYRAGAASDLRVTLNAQPNGGVVRLALHYHKITAPTS